jgi:hypothetical protein
MEQRVSYRVPRAYGPRVAVIGGGHGLSTMLRGLKQYTENISAIVTVAAPVCCARTWGCRLPATFATAWRPWPIRSR